MTSHRIILRNIYHLVVGNQNDDRLRGVDLLIDGHRIMDIGQGLPKGDAEVIDASTKLVIPGLVNTHHHMYQTLQRNLPAVQNAELFDWLIYLYEIWKHLTPEAVKASTLLACAELLKTGCTTTMDHHYVFPQAVNADLIGIQFEAAQQIGMRFCATRGSMSRGKSKSGLPPDSVVQDEDIILADSERLITAYHDNSPFAMRRLALAPCSPFSVSEALMERSMQMARRYGVKLHTHLAETKDEEAFCLEKYGCRPLRLMERLGWLGEDVWFAHGIHFNQEELDLLAKSKTGIAHCPSSNMRLGSGIARIPEMIKKGIPVGLAVDGSASNDTSDMMGEMRSCLLLHRVLGGAKAISAKEVFALATRGGAQLLGWPEVGSLEVGKAADIVMVEMDRLDYVGALSDPLAAIIFSGLSHQAHTVIVNGKIVLENGQLTQIDEQHLKKEAQTQAKKMLERAGVDISWML